MSKVSPLQPFADAIRVLTDKQVAWPEHPPSVPAVVDAAERVSTQPSDFVAARLLVGALLTNPRVQGLVAEARRAGAQPLATASKALLHLSEVLRNGGVGQVDATEFERLQSELDAIERVRASIAVPEGWELLVVPATEHAVGYLAFIPETDREVPATIFLHGIKERGDGQPEALAKVLSNGPGKLIAAGEWGPELGAVFVPQHSGDTWSFTPEGVREFVAHVRDTFGDRVDVDRVALAGYSAGGHSVWNYLAEYHDKPEGAWIRAAAVVSGSVLQARHGNRPIDGELSALDRMKSAESLRLPPIRIAFDATDQSVPMRYSCPDELRGLGLNLEVQELEGVGHRTSDPFFRSDAFRSWLRENR